jgi:uncharacterized protein YciI
MHFALMYEVVDDYVERRAAFRADHLKLAREAHDRGDLVLAGAFTEPADGALIVFRSENSAEQFAKSDPYVKSGIVKSWRVRKWNVVVGDGASV